MRRLAGVFALLHFFAQGNGQEQELYQYLMQNYIKDLRPVRDANDVTHVVFHPTVEYLVQVDELHESFTALFWFSMLWHDQFLVWNASEFGGINNIHLPAKTIWRPDLFVYGAVKNEFALAIEDTVAVVQANGLVVLELVQVVQMFCPFDIEFFPFDKQNCSMEFGSWSYSSDKVSFTALKDYGNTDYLLEQPEWDIISFESNLQVSGIYELGDSLKNETYDELYYHFVFKRKPVYYIFNLVIPSFLITILSLIGLFAPFSSTGERQEKVTLGLTSLLAMSLILDLVGKEVPKTSKGIPLLSRFVLFQFTIIALAMLTTVAIVGAHKAIKLRKQPPPSWLLRILLVKHTARRKSYWFNHNLDTFEPEYVNAAMQNIKLDLLGRILTDLIASRSHLHTIAYATQLKLQNRHSMKLWILIFDRIDQCCLFLYLLGNIILTLLLLVGN